MNRAQFLRPGPPSLWRHPHRGLVRRILASCSGLHRSIGTDHLAEDTVLGRKVAIKFIRPGSSASSQQERRRFLGEAQAVARLSHPNVVAVYGFGEFDGQPYIVSEYVPGVSLDRLDQPVPWRR